MKRSEQLAIGAILLSAGVIFVPTKAEPLLLTETGFQTGKNQPVAWQSAGLSRRPQAGSYYGNAYMNPFPFSVSAAERATGLLWHRFSFVTPPIVAYWLMAARQVKCCWKRLNAGAQCSECL